MRAYYARKIQFVQAYGYNSGILPQCRRGAMPVTVKYNPHSSRHLSYLKFKLAALLSPAAANMSVSTSTKLSDDSGSNSLAIIKRGFLVKEGKIPVGLLRHSSPAGICRQSA